MRSLDRSQRKKNRARTRGEWRAWLERHHATEPEVWLVFAKKHTGKPSVRYAEAVEEALCFGWIDTTVNRLDEDHYVQRFTPRTDTRNWSKINLERFERLVSEGRMTDAGRAKLPPDVTPPPRRVQASDPVPGFIRKALAAHPAARRKFLALAPTYRRDYIRWIVEGQEARDARASPRRSDPATGVEPETRSTHPARGNVARVDPRTKMRMIRFRLAAA